MKEENPIWLALDEIHVSNYYSIQYAMYNMVDDLALHIGSYEPGGHHPLCLLFGSGQNHHHCQEMVRS